MIKFESDKKFSEVIVKEDIAKWKGNVIFEGGTATGKTHFVLNTLQEYCFDNGMSILFLCNRTKLADEVKADITDKGIFNIEVETYQNIEDMILNETLIEKKYDFLICDEFHHVLEVYNLYTDLSFKWIMNHPAQKIFMSATCSGLFNILINTKKVHTDNHYYIPKSYDYVEKFIFYNRKDAYLDIVKDLLENTEDKIIYFASSLEKAIELYEQYKDISTFYCSIWTKNEKAKEILKENEGRINNKTFEGRLLISSTALDVGITLKDYGIKHIICNIFDYSQLIQCLGRKRIIDKSDKSGKYIEDKVDSCTFYIRNYSKRQLNMFRNTKLLEEMMLFKDDREQWNNTYLKDRAHKNKYIPYNQLNKDFELNYVAYIKIISSEQDLNEMTQTIWTDSIGNNHEGLGYKWFILNKLGISLYDERVQDYETYEEQHKQNDLVTYLDSIVGQPLFKNEQSKLKEVFKKNGLKARTMGINTLNGNLKDRKIPYKIDAKRTNSKRYWEVDNNIDWKLEG